MKKFTLLQVNLLLFALMLILASCSKQEYLTHSSSNAESNAIANTVQPNHLPGGCPYPCTDIRCKAYINGYCGVAIDPITVKPNITNIDDTVGQVHNEAMAAILPNYSNGSLEPTQQNVTSYTLSYLTTRGYDSTTVKNIIDSSVNNYGTLSENDTSISSLAATLYNNSSISSTAKNYLIQLSNYISSYTVDSIDIPTQASYDSFANNLIAEESLISNNSSLSSNDKNILLSAYSVARYSAEYSSNFAASLQSSGTQPSVATNYSSGPSYSFTSFMTISTMV